MPPSTMQFALPEFRGLTRRLVLFNIATFFTILILNAAHLVSVNFIVAHFGFTPTHLLAGEIWQPVTASFVQVGLVNTLLNLLALWFLGSILEEWHGASWFGWLFAISILGSMLTALVVYGGMRAFAPTQLTPNALLIGIGDGLFGLLVAIGVLHGDVEFRLMMLIPIKARYLAIIAALIALAYAFGDAPVYAIAQLGAGLAAFLYVRRAPRRGIASAAAFSLSERWYGMRNGYYRWKRRRAASKFQVYMKKQGRTVRFDGQGRLLDDDDRVDPDDKKRWN